MIINRPGDQAPTGRLARDLRDDLPDAIRFCNSSYPYPRTSSLKQRLKDDIWYYTLAYSVMKRDDSLFIVMTDPPLLPIVAALSGKRYVVWLQDCFPDIAVKAGVIPAWIGVPIRWLMTWALKRAEKVVVIGRCMQDHLKTWGVESVVIPNWVDGKKWPYVPPTGFKRAYLGRANTVHGYRGHTVTNLSDADFLKACQNTHTHIVTLRPEMLGLSVPSKVYTALACGRYVEWHGPKESEAYLIATEAGATNGLRSTEEIRRFFEHYCDRKVQTEKWFKLLSSL